MKSKLHILFALTFLLGAGRIQTRDGKTIEGDISLDENTVIVRAQSDSRIAWDQVASLTMQTKPGQQIESAKTGATLPEGWKTQDIGRVRFPGTATCDAAGTFTVSASGWGAWGANDSFHFSYRPLEGDGQIIAHVGKLDSSNGPVVAGVMIRQSLAPDAPMAGACLYPSGEVRMPRRPAGGGGPFKQAEEITPSAWVRLARSGEMLSSYRSADGKYWQLIEKRKIAMEKNARIGIAVWTTGNAWVGSAVIDSVRIVPGTPGLSYFPGGDDLAGGVMLRDGNIVACDVVGLDEKSVYYQRDGKGFAIPVNTVARLIFNPLPPDYATPTDKPGVLLSSGDFIDGDITAVSLQAVEWPRPPQLKVSARSVLFGPRNFEISKEVIAVDLAPVQPAPANYEVRTADGSLKRAKNVSITKEAFIVDGAKTSDVTQVRKIQ